jgi:lambda repressor-like predicted transcriptional regulator
MFNQAYDDIKKIHLNLMHFHKELILSSPILTFLYAKHVLHGPFSEGEAIIATDSEFAYDYARNILYAPFLSGEPAIARDSFLAYLYAANVLKGPFPLGEKAIAKNSDMTFGKIWER